MDHFREEVVVKHNRVIEEILYYLSAVIMVVTGLIAMMYLSVFTTALMQQGFEPFSLIFTLVNGGICALCFLRRNRLRTEYEYTFTNGAFDFAMVFNNNKRKSLGSLNVKTVDAFGPVNSSAFQRYISTPNVKQSRWFLNRGAELYYFYFAKDGNKRIIVCEPSADLVSDIKHYLPFGAYQE